MRQRLELPTFVAGPEAGGRGFRILASHGLGSDASWHGDLPLVLLGWARLRSPAGFCGRFPVAGGFIALRGAYLEEGSAGPIAQANGIFVRRELATQVFANERALIEALAPVTADTQFASAPATIDLGRPSQPAKPVFKSLGLEWRDRQIFVEADLLLEEVALSALESIAIPQQRDRIRGWCTTTRLAPNGDFFPMRGCNLLVTSTDEPLEDARFLPGRINVERKFVDERIQPAPTAYTLWQKLHASNLGDDADLSTWALEMAEWSEADVAWHHVGELSKQGLSYADMAKRLAALPAVAGEAAGKAAILKYLDAVAKQDAGRLPLLLDLLREASLTDSVCRKAILEFTISSGADSLIGRLNGDELLTHIIAFDQQRRAAGASDKSSPSDLVMLDALDDRSVALADGGSEGERRDYLSRLNLALRVYPLRGGITRAQAHRLHRRRKAIEQRLFVSGAG